MKLSRLLRRDPAAPTLRDRAAALREGLNRREAVLGVAVTAAVPLPAMAANAIHPHPDADLIALWRHRQEAHQAERMASARWNAIPHALDTIPAPEAVFLQAGDEALSIAHLAVRNSGGRLWYCVGEPGSDYRAARLRHPIRRARTRPVRPEDRLPADAISVTEGHPAP